MNTDPTYGLTARAIVARVLDGHAELTETVRERLIACIAHELAMADGDRISGSREITVPEGVEICGYPVGRAPALRDGCREPGIHTAHDYITDRPLGKIVRCPGRGL